MICFVRVGVYSIGLVSPMFTLRHFLIQRFEVSFFSIRGICGTWVLVEWWWWKLEELERMGKYAFRTSCCLFSLNKGWVKCVCFCWFHYTPGATLYSLVWKPPWIGLNRDRSIDPTQVTKIKSMNRLPWSGRFGSSSSRRRPSRLAKKKKRFISPLVKAVGLNGRSIPKRCSRHISHDRDRSGGLVTTTLQKMCLNHWGWSTDWFHSLTLSSR